MMTRGSSCSLKLISRLGENSAIRLNKKSVRMTALLMFEPYEE